MKIEIRKPLDNEIEKLQIIDWPTWSCNPSTFDWSYSDKETCYLLEGDVTVVTAEETVYFGAGDMVVFPAGLSCTWHVKKTVNKHYQFG
jgi:uncharacterized cupin superfamily protein